MIELTFLAIEAGETFTVRTDLDRIVQQLKDSLQLGIVLISVEEVE